VEFDPELWAELWVELDPDLDPPLSLPLPISSSTASSMPRDGSVRVSAITVVGSGDNGDNDAPAKLKNGSESGKGQEVAARKEASRGFDGERVVRGADGRTGRREAEGTEGRGADALVAERAVWVELEGRGREM
jgi:hypothetical protein